MRGLLVGGTHSGVGKTTVTLAILKALRDRGYSVQAFKTGPDFIDASHYEGLTAAPCYNLDLFMMGAKGIARELAKSTADIIVIEGAMGLYDGDSSSADIAAAIGAPVVLIIDASASAESVAASALGFARYSSYTSYQPSIVGVIANKVASAAHVNKINNALNHVGIPLVGALHKNAWHIPSRHLGLHMGYETPLDEQALQSIQEDLDLDKLINLTSEIHVERLQAAASADSGVTIGIAHDAAFCFYYRTNIEALQSAADVVFFSPLSDVLPDVDGLYIGGGYPELYAKPLSTNVKLLEDFRTKAAEGMPIYGECGGLMYLGRSLATRAGTFDMVGVIPAETYMTDHIQALGHSEVEVVRDCAIARQGERIRGHEYHYSATTVDADATFAYRMTRGRGIAGYDGITEYNVLGSYHHAHVYSMKEGFAAFISNAKKYSKS